MGPLILLLEICLEDIIQKKPNDRSFFESQRILSLLIKSLRHIGVCVCILRGIWSCVSSIGTSLLDDFKGNGLYLTLLWRNAFTGNISSIRLILVAGVRKRLASFDLLWTFPQRRADVWHSGWAWARKKMSSCFLVETSSSVSERGGCFMLRLNVSRNRSSSLREIEWPQQRERNSLPRPGFSEANSALEINSSADTLLQLSHEGGEHARAKETCMLNVLPAHSLSSRQGYKNYQLNPIDQY